jgi:hypothetical protein
MSGFPGWEILYFYGGQIFICLFVYAFTTKLYVYNTEIIIIKPFMPFYKKRSIIFKDVNRINFLLFKNATLEVYNNNGTVRKYTMFIETGKKYEKFYALIDHLRTYNITVTYNIWGERG